MATAEDNILLPKNDRKELFGWLMYDWANSVFYTTVITVVLGPYLMEQAQKSVGINGVVINFGFIGSATAESLYTLCISASVLLQFFLLPILGAIADYTNMKKRLMAFFCYLGVVASSLLFFVTGENYLWGYLLMIIANVGFGASIVFYNAYLVDLTTDDKRDSISSWGFAFGYLGTVTMLLLNMLLIINAQALGMSDSRAKRLCMLAASLWWGGFSLLTFFMVKSRGAVNKVPPGKNLVKVGFGELWHTLMELIRLKYTARFLLCYLLYNDGIQTVINVSSVFLAQELFIVKGLEVSQLVLMGMFLEAQITGLIGALVFERIARVIGTKTTIIITLVGWALIVIYAYAFLNTFTEAWIMCGAIGLVLGSSQALSRSLFSQMIPVGKESAFFSLYEISDKGTSWLGPLVFSVVVASTGSYRHAILALIIFFVFGSIALLFTDTDRAVREAQVAGE
jgi:UMF1 family MFS transporter